MLCRDFLWWQQIKMRWGGIFWQDSPLTLQTNGPLWGEGRESIAAAGFTINTFKWELFMPWQGFLGLFKHDFSASYVGRSSFLCTWIRLKIPRRFNITRIQMTRPAVDMDKHWTFIVHTGSFILKVRKQLLIPPKIEVWETSRAYKGLTRCSPFDKIWLFCF